MAATSGKRSTIEASAVSTASAAVIYAMLLDRPSWPSWSPLGSFEPEHDGIDGPQSVGATGTFVTRRTRAHEEIVELRPNERLSYVLLDGMPLTGYRADIDLSPEANGTKITWRSGFVARTGTAWFYRGMMRVLLGKMVRGLAVAAARQPAATSA